jgi:Protein kinase domain/PQQ-like domain
VPSTGPALVRQGDLPNGTRIGPPATPDRYETGRPLGKGGFGTAYLALDRSERRPCVVKEIMDAAAGGGISAAEQQSLFEREAKLLASLQHPGLPNVWDAFAWQSRRYMVMSYEKGESLEEIARNCRGRMAEERAIAVAHDVAMILGYLHARTPPVIHRDISPDNIIRRADGSHVLLDFGAARFYSADRARDTIPLGKLGYAAPEATAGQTDGRSDLYSLGAVLYRLCVDYDPPSDPFRFPSLDGSGLSDSFRSILERLVATKRDRRFQSAQELLLALNGLTTSAALCQSCRRPIPAGAWRCVCGRSLLSEVSWATLGGDPAHSGRAPDTWADRGLAWKAKVGEELIGGAVGRRGVAVVVGADGTVTGIDAFTGQATWMRSIVGSSPACGGPALVGGHAVVAIGRDLWSFDLASGQASPLATLDTSGPYAMTPIGTVLHVVSNDGHRWELEFAERTVRRRADTGFEVRHGPACVSDRVIVGGVRGDLRGYIRGIDEPLWGVDLAFPATSGVVIAGRTAISVSTSGEIRGVDVDTGRDVGECPVHDQVYATPCITGSTLVVSGRTFLSIVDVVRWEVVARYPLVDALRSAAPVLLGAVLYTADLVSGVLRATDAANGSSRVVGEVGTKIGGWLACIDGWIVAASASGRVAGVGPT